jgi:hypothetical protein
MLASGAFTSGRRFGVAMQLGWLFARQHLAEPKSHPGGLALAHSSAIGDGGAWGGAGDGD